MISNMSHLEELVERLGAGSLSFDEFFVYFLYYGGREGVASVVAVIPPDLLERIQEDLRRLKTQEIIFGGAEWFGVISAETVQSFKDHFGISS